jgi:hypothetical protein
MTLSPFAEPAEPVLVPQAKEYGLRCGHDAAEHQHGPIYRGHVSSSGVRRYADEPVSQRAISREAYGAPLVDGSSGRVAAEPDPDLGPTPEPAIIPDDQPLGLSYREILERKAEDARRAREAAEM